MEIKKTIGDNLSALRKSKKLTQLDIAEKFNFSDKAVSKWESGETTPNIETLTLLCKFYGVSLDEVCSSKIDISANEKEITKSNKNKLFIALLIISVFWIFSTSFYVYFILTFNYNLYQLFVWVVPMSFAFAVLFNFIWGRKKYHFLLLTALLWTTITATYIQFLQYNIWVVFLVGVPTQISIILWSSLK